MKQRRIIFDVQSLLRLLTHYTEGKVPPDAELVQWVWNPAVPYWMTFNVRSAQWPADTPINPKTKYMMPLQIRYTGNKVMKWDEHGQPIKWEDAPEAPKRR